jgi:ParB family chromosome partitioning protein
MQIKTSEPLLGRSTLGNNNGAPNRAALGRGLGALIPTKGEQRDFFECPLARIHPTPDQPRRHFDEDALAELTESIRATGLIQPLVVRQHGNDYQLIAGERRWRAAQRAGLTTVPVVIKDVDLDTAFEIALIENIQRQDLNPVEEALAYQRLLDMRSLTQDALAQQLGKSRSAIANTLRLLQLSPALQARVAAGELSGGAARALLALPEGDDQAHAAHAALTHDLNVRQIEALAREVRQGASLQEALDALLHPHANAQDPLASDATTAAPQQDLFARPAPAPRDRDTQTPPGDRDRRKALATELSQALGVKAQIKNRGDGGSIEIAFKDPDTLNRLIALLLRDH